MHIHSPMNACPRGHEIYNFGRPFLDHHYYLLSLSDPCPGVEKKIFKEILYFHYLTCILVATTWYKNPCPRGHDIYKFGWPFYGHHYYIFQWFVCSNYTDSVNRDGEKGKNYWTSCPLGQNLVYINQTVSNFIKLLSLEIFLL